MTIACQTADVLATGNLNITSTPNVARIWLAPTGQTLLDQGVYTDSILTAVVGTYDIKLVLAGYQDWTGTATVLDGQTTTVSALLISLTCPASPKYSGDTVTMNATPIQGVAPYTVQFRKSPDQSMGNDEIAAIEIIPDSRIPGGNNISGVAEGTTITRIYTLGSTDLEGATTKSGDTGPSIIFAAEMIDSCTPPQSCIKYCKIFVGCTVPVCDFTVT